MIVSKAFFVGMLVISGVTSKLTMASSSAMRKFFKMDRSSEVLGMYDGASRTYGVRMQLMYFDI